MTPEKICVIHLNQIGDLAFSMPLLKTLRENYPKATIHSVVKPYLRELLIGSPYVDEILLRSSSLPGKIRLFMYLWKQRYDLTICLPRSEESLIMTLCSGAKVKAGFSTFFGNRVLDIKEKIEGHPCWYNNAKLLQRLGLTIPQNNYLGFFSTDADISSFDLPPNIVVISPGASKKRQAKTWPREYYSELIVKLWRQYALTAVMVGDESNVEANAQIIQEAQRIDTCNEITPLDLTGKNGLRALCAVLKKARLFVGIDSGVMHLASAVDIPVVGMFGPTDPFYVGPQNKNHRVVRREDMTCVPCYLKNCSHLTCMQTLSVEKVLQACDELLTQ
jgi:ADP-heptose:LPS heptosyltransferase